MARRLVITGRKRPKSRAMEVRIDNNEDARAEEAGLIPWYPLRADGTLPHRPMGTLMARKREISVRWHPDSRSLTSKDSGR